MNQTQKHTTGKKLLALLLALIMSVSLLPMSVFAADLGTEAPIVEGQTQQDAALDESSGEEEIVDSQEPVEDVQEPTEDETDVTDADTQAMEGDVAVQADATADVTYKILHLDCGRKYFSKEWIIALLYEMKDAGYNQLQLAFGNDGLRFLLDDMKFTANNTTYYHETVVSKVEDGNKAQNSSGDTRWLTQSEMDGIIATAKTLSIEIVPLLNLPGHANAILDIVANDAYNATVNGSVSQNTLDVTNSKACDFAYALFTKYVDYFAGKGCKFFNFGADEYGNDVGGTPHFDALGSSNYKNYFAPFINRLAAYIVSKGMTPRTFNDGLYYNKNNPWDMNLSTNTSIGEIQCCYWSSGWDAYPVATASQIYDKGHSMINTHGNYYYVLGKSDNFDSGYSYASGFDNTDFMGSTINNPVGSMFCIWCDYPNEEAETVVAQKVRLPLRAMALRMDNQSIVNMSTAVVTNGFNADGTLNNSTGGETGGDTDPTTKDITLTVGESTTITVDNSVTTGDYITGNDAYIATAEVAASAAIPSGVKQVTSITSGKRYIIAPAGSTGKVLGNTVDTNGANTWAATGLGIESATISDANVNNLLQHAWTITEINGKYTVQDADENYWVFGTNNNYLNLAENNGTQMTIGTRGNYFYFCVAAANGGNPYYVNNFGGENIFASVYQENLGNGDLWALYEITEETAGGNSLTITGVGEDTISAKVGNVTYNITVTAPEKKETVTLAPGESFTLPAGTADATVTTGNDVVSVSAGVIKAGTTEGEATVTTVVKNAGGKITARYTYTVVVSKINYDEIDPLHLEYWITNAPIGTVDGVKSDTRTNASSNTYTYYFSEISAAAAATAAGIKVTDIAPSETARGNRTVYYWRCRLLDMTSSNQSASGKEQQTNDDGDDETASGVGFTAIRYYAGNWQVCTDSGEWVNVSLDDNQLIAYYREYIKVTDEVESYAADWGKKGDGSTSGDYLNPSTACTISYQVVYEDGNTNPVGTTADDLKSKTIVYGYWTDHRGIGTIMLGETADYEIYKVTAETGAMTGSSDGNYDPFTVNSFTWDDNEVTVWDEDTNERDANGDVVIQNNAKKPNEAGVYNNLQWDDNYESILIRVYVRAKVTEDALTVHYINRTVGNEFYNYNIAVKSGTVFKDQIALRNPWKDTLINGDVENKLGKTQWITADLSKMPEIEAGYRYAFYTCEEVKRSDDGKEVFLYYVFSNETSFVVDFGLELQIPLSRLSDALNAAKIESVTVSGAKFGNTAYDSDTKVITYQPTKVINDVEKLNVEITGTLTYIDDDGKQQEKRGTVSYIVNIIPASTVYYEDSFAKFYDAGNSEAKTDFTATSDTDAMGTWYVDGTEMSMPDQALEELGKKNNVYGYDPAYTRDNNSTTFSMGSAKKVTVDANTYETKGGNPTAQFTFKGTGFDVISLTDNRSGAIKVEVYNASTQEKVKGYFVNNYYGYTYTNGAWEVVKPVEGQKSNAMYQIPVIKVADLPWAEYNVVITAAYSSIFDTAGSEQYSFWLDAVRVYDPMGKDYDYKSGENSDNESYPQFIRLRNALADKDAVIAGEGKVVFIDGGNTGDIATYANYGPNNEVYLANGQAISFKVPENANIASIQIGAKAPQDDTTAKLSVDKATLKNNATTVDISTATEMYYELFDAQGKVVTIANEGNGILSLTNLKITFTEKQNSTLTLAALSDEDQANAVAAVRALFAAPVEPEPDPEPETFEPERFEVSWNRSTVKVGQKATLTVKTSEDVDAITVDGETVTNYRTRTQRTGWGWNAKKVTYREFTYTVTAAEAGTLNYSVVATDADGVNSEAFDAPALTVQAASQRPGIGGWLDNIFGRWF